MKTNIPIHPFLRTLVSCLALGGLALFTSCSGGDDDHDGHDHGDHASADGGGDEHEGHDHGDGDADTDADGKGGEKSNPGPNGGRVITEVEPHLEFLLNDDHSIQIVALTADYQAAPIGSQVVTVTGGERTAPADLSFTKKGDALVSDGTFPEGKDLPVIVSIQANADAEPVFARFTLNLSDCPTCEHKEYACICAHAGE